RAFLGRRSLLFLRSRDSKNSPSPPPPAHFRRTSVPPNRHQKHRHHAFALTTNDRQVAGLLLVHHVKTVVVTAVKEQLWRITTIRFGTVGIVATLVSQRALSQYFPLQPHPLPLRSQFCR